MLNRRELLVGAAGALLGSAVLPRRAAGQLPSVVTFNERLSLVQGGGTNVLALTAPDGLVVVDSGLPEQAGVVASSLKARVPDGRVNTVFNTHWHLENTGANETLAESGARIVAHQNTRLWMATPTWMPGEDRYRQPRPPAAHPATTFYTDGAMTAGAEHIEYGYLIDAHTSGDIYVFFRDANVLAVGDVASPVRDPELDWFTGAWIGGRVDAMARLLTLSNADTRIVPGYGPPMRRAELQAEHDMMKTIYDRVFERVRQGDEAGDMLEAGVMKGLARTWSNPEKFLYDVNKGLWAHHNKLSPDVV
jgi:cyclase